MTRNLPRLYFSSNNESKLLPEWAYFFMRLGYQLATKPYDNSRFVIGLAIPTRVFACSLVASGIALARADNETNTESVHLQSICQLRPGTHVYVHDGGNRKHPGVVKGFNEFQGEQLIIIQTGMSEETGYPIKHYASRITVRSQGTSLPKYKQKGYATEAPSEFLQCCLGEQLAEKYILETSFEALLIGKKALIQRETTAIPFSCRISNESPWIYGYLQDILRIRQFSSENKPFRMQCISLSNSAPEEEIGKEPPPIVVFDGAIAYIKSGHNWIYSHQIVLLDRTERQFLDAIGLINQNFDYRLADNFKFPINIPDGIEIMVYRDGIQ